MKAFVSAVTACALLLLPVVASAQSTDAQYCGKLSAEIRRVTGTGSAPDTVSAAMTKCSSDPASAIPVLEQHLKNNKVTLPSR